MEFLRFGSSIPGSYWGCCACCIIQNFKVDPDALASIQIVSGDGGGPIGDTFAGPTWRDIFWQRLRIGTFSTNDMPNHTFLAILEGSQISSPSSVGGKWLAILKEAGFEFLRTVDNSVYTGPNLGNPVKGGSHPNYIFGLFRNIGAGAVDDPFKPPKAWTDLGDDVKLEANEFIREKDTLQFAELQRAADLAIWNKIGKAKFLTMAEVQAAGAPVTLAGLRSANQQELKTTRDSRNGVSKQVSLKGPSPELVAPCPAAPVPG